MIINGRLGAAHRVDVMSRMHTGVEGRAQRGERRAEGPSWQIFRRERLPHVRADKIVPAIHRDLIASLPLYLPLYIDRTSALARAASGSSSRCSPTKLTLFSDVLALGIIVYGG